MIVSTESGGRISSALDEVGMGTALRNGGSAVIKINLARIPEPCHPRTDVALLADTIRYIADSGSRCAVAEGADGHLGENLCAVGLGSVIEEHHVEVLDLDTVGFDCVVVDDEKHYLPRCLKDFAVRIAIPATSQRPGMVFSNNVKLFVGAVPRRMYQLGEPSAWRPRLHVDLHKSVANVYRAITSYAPFSFFVNGGKAMVEGRGELVLREVLVGTDALELDRYMLTHLDIEPPEYLLRLS